MMGFIRKPIGLVNCYGHNDLCNKEGYLKQSTSPYFLKLCSLLGKDIHTLYLFGMYIIFFLNNLNQVNIC